MSLDSQGALALLAVEPGASPHTFDTGSEAYEFLAETLGLKGSILETGGIRGTRSHHSAPTRRGPSEVGGTIRLHPSPAGLDKWLPRILGADESSDTFALAETLPTFGVLIDRVAQTFQYTDCVVNKAAFRAQAGQLVELELDVMGRTEATGGAFPAIAPGSAANDAPYAWADATLTLAGGTREVLDWEIMIDNQLQRRFANSITATSITPQDRIVTVKATVPFTASELALYGQAVTGATGSLVLTNGNMSTTFTFATLQVPPVSPNVSGKSSIHLTLEMTARMSGDTRELVVTHDSTA